MDKIQTNYRFNLLSPILYLIAYYYVLMASINDGFSGFFLGIPYVIFLLWEIWFLKKESKIKYLHSAIVLLAVFFLFSDRSQSRLFYPMVGKTYTITNDINYSYGGFYINKIEIYDKPYNNFLDEEQAVFPLKSGDRFHIESQMVTSHADFGISYTFGIHSKSFSVLDAYIAQNLAKIKVKLHQYYAKSFHKEKTDFYFENEKQFYIHEHELRRLMEAQGLAYHENNFETKFTYISFSIVVYPVILVLFFLMLTFRNKEIFYKEK